MDHFEPSLGWKELLRYPAVASITRAPEWAGDLSEKLLRRTQEQTKLGIYDPQFANHDPLAVLNEWFGAGNPRTKNALEPSLEDFDDRRVRVFRPSRGTRRLHIDRALAQSDVVTVSYSLNGKRTETVKSFEFDHALLRSVKPMRDFARRLKQTNKPVATWLHTVGHHVGTESLHERTFAMLADHHPAVTT